MQPNHDGVSPGRRFIQAGNPIIREMHCAIYDDELRGVIGKLCIMRLNRYTSIIGQALLVLESRSLHNPLKLRLC